MAQARPTDIAATTSAQAAFSSRKTSKAQVAVMTKKATGIGRADIGVPDMKRRGCQEGRGTEGKADRQEASTDQISDGDGSHSEQDHQESISHVELRSSFQGQFGQRW